MKINKIICDVCKIDIDVTEDESMALFEFIRTQAKINIIRQDTQSPGGLLEGEKIIMPNKEIVKTSFDLCKKCAKEAETYLKDKIEEKKKLAEDNDKSREQEQSN